MFINKNKLTMTKGMTVVALSALSLIACKHKNQLASITDKQAVAKALAFYSAEQSRAQGTDMASGQSDYQRCLDGQKVKINCNKLYEDMASAMRKEALFKLVTATDLKDKDFFNSIREDYRHHAFQTL